MSPASHGVQGTDRQPSMHSPPENLDSSLQNIVLRPTIHQFIAVLLPLPQRPLHPFPISTVRPIYQCRIVRTSTSASSHVIKRSVHTWDFGTEEYMSPKLLTPGPSFFPLLLRQYTPRWPPAGATICSALSWHRCFVARHSPAAPGWDLRPREDSLAARRSNKYFHFGLVLFLEPLPRPTVLRRGSSSSNGQLATETCFAKGASRPERSVRRATRRHLSTAARVRSTSQRETRTSLITGEGSLALPRTEAMNGA